jgi:tetratricopeptide (TPR) repeat protein
LTAPGAKGSLKIEIKLKSNMAKNGALHWRGCALGGIWQNVGENLGHRTHKGAYMAASPLAKKLWIGLAVLCAGAGLYGLFTTTSHIGEQIRSAMANAQLLEEHWKRCRLDEKYSYEEQIGACTAIIKAGGDDKADLASAHYFRGDGYYNTERDQLALDDYNISIRLNPKDYYGYASRGVVYHERKELGRALEDYTIAIGLDKENSYSLRQRGTIYLQQKKWDAALVDFEAAAKIDPENADMLFGRGIAKIRLGQPAQGKTDIAAANKSDPDMAANYAAFDLKP